MADVFGICKIRWHRIITPNVPKTKINVFFLTAVLANMFFIIPLTEHYKFIADLYFRRPLPQFFPCVNGCGRKYRHRRSMLKHIKFECGEKKQFKCRYCGRNFAHKYTVRTHLAYVHRIVMGDEQFRRYFEEEHFVGSKLIKN